MAVTVFLTSNGGQLGLNDTCCMYSPSSHTDLTIFKTGMVDKKDLGEDGVVIPFEKIARVDAVLNKKAPVFISAKGMGDDIGIFASGIAEQRQIVDTIKNVSGQPLCMHNSKASIMQAAGKTLALTIISAIFTICGAFAAYDAQSGIDIVSSKSGFRGVQENTFASLVKELGVSGTLIVGGIITAAFMFVLVLKLKNRPCAIQLKLNR